MSAFTRRGILGQGVFQRNYGALLRFQSQVRSLVYLCLEEMNIDYQLNYERATTI